MKKVGKRIYAFTAILLVLTLAFGLTACKSVERKGPTPEERTVEVHTELDVTTLKEGSAYTDFKVTKGDREIALTDNTIVFDELGEYSIAYKKTAVWKITVQDTTAPVVQIAGSFHNLQEESEVSLPQISVIDNYDGVMADYTVSVIHDGAAVPVSNGKFTVETYGDYTLTVTAADSSNNVGEASRAFTVDARHEVVVAAGAEITLLPRMAKSVLPAGTNENDYNYTYAVYPNGASAPTTAATFTVQSNSYYMAYITATDKQNSAKTYTISRTYSEEHAKLLTFTGKSAAACETSFHVPTKGAEKQVVKGADGNTEYKATVNDFTRLDSNDKNKMELQMFPIAWGAPNEATHEYNLGVDVRVKGKLAPEKTSAKLSFQYSTRNTGDKEIAEKLTLTGEAGGDVWGVAHLACQNIGVPSWQVDAGISQFSMGIMTTLPIEDLCEGVEIYFDNAQLSPAAKPTITVATPVRKTEAGSTLTLAPQTFGITAEGFFGAPVAEIKATKVEKGKDKTDVTESALAAGEVTIAENDLYTITYTATDFYGNSNTTEVIAQDKDADFIAPVFTKVTGKTDNVVLENAEITLGTNGIEGYLTVTDDVDDSVAVVYDKVVKNGEVQPNVSTITVAKGDVWEVYASATDNKQNTGYAYILFSESSISDHVVSFNDGRYEVNLASSGEAFIKDTVSNSNVAVLYKATYAQIYTDPVYGKKSLRAQYGDGYQIGFFDPYKDTHPDWAGGMSEVKVRLVLGVVGTQSGLQDSDVLLKLAGNINQAITVADIGTIKGYTDEGSLCDATTGQGIILINKDIEDMSNFTGQSGLYLQIDRIALISNKTTA